MTRTAAANPTPALQCMEVWGDNRAAERAVAMPGLDAWVYSRPAGADEAGGDVHYVSSCATGRIIRLLLADVSGHGAPAADVAASLRRLMHRYMNHADQRRLLAAINREFLGLAGSGQFATAVVISCWTPTGELTVSNAGHPSPLVFSAPAGGWRPLFAPGEHANIPLGIEARAEFGQVRVTLGRDDLLMAFTDGLTESRAEGGAMLGQSGVLEILDGLGGLDADELIHGLTRSVAERRSGLPCDDDLSLLLIRPNEQRPRSSLVGGVVAGVRVMRSILGSATRPRSAPVPEIRASGLLGAFSDRFNGRGSG